MEGVRKRHTFGAMWTASERFTVLDGMRGLAALVVITDHVPSEALMVLLPGRHLAVDFFFAVSGFVLTHVYERRFREGLSVTEFVQRRVLRLYPLYLVALVGGAILAWLKVEVGSGEESLGQLGASFVLNALYLPAPPAISIHADEPFPFNGPAWSLFFELVINIAFALMILRLKNRVLAMIVVLAALGVTVTAFAFGQLDPGFLWSNFWGGFTRVAYAFFAGVLIYRLRSAWPAPTLPVWLAFAALLGVFCIPASGVWRALWDVTAVTIVFPLLIAGTSKTIARGWVGRFCTLGGALSYGFYVLQVPVRDWTYSIFWREGINLPEFGVVAVALVAGITLAMTSMLHFGYDVPIRRVLSRRLFGS